MYLHSHLTVLCCAQSITHTLAIWVMLVYILWANTLQIRRGKNENFKTVQN